MNVNLIRNLCSSATELSFQKAAVYSCAVGVTAMAALYRPIETMASLAAIGCVLVADKYLATRTRKECPKIEILAIYALGYGDLICGLNVASGLSKQLGNQAQISLVTNLPDTMKAIAGDDYPIPISGTQSMEAPDLRIQIPVCTDHDQFPNYPASTAHWKIQEYGGGTLCGSTKGKKCATMGVAPDEIGIFINKDLRTFSDRFPLGEPVQDISFLSDLNTTSLKDLILQDKAPLEYSETNQLYYSYIHDTPTIPYALLTCAAKESGSNKNLDLVLPGNRFPDMLFHVKGSISNIADELEKLGYGKIEFHYRDASDNWKTESENLNNSDNPAIRVILPGTIPNTDCHKLLKASDDLCFFTGDQSASEGFSGGKTFIYETKGHKRSFSNSVIKLSASISSTNLQQWMGKFKLNSDYDLRKSEHETYISLGRLAREKETRIGFRKLCNKVCSREVTAELTRRVKKWASYSFLP